MVPPEKNPPVVFNYRLLLKKSQCSPLRAGAVIIDFGFKDAWFSDTEFVS